jgi:hypothetical protein
LFPSAPDGVLATYQPRHRGASARSAYDFAEVIAGELVAAGFHGIRTQTLPLEPVPAICILATR